MIHTCQSITVGSGGKLLLHFGASARCALAKNVVLTGSKTQVPRPERLELRVRDVLTRGSTVVTVLGGG